MDYIHYLHQTNLDLEFHILSFLLWIYATDFFSTGLLYIVVRVK